MGAPSAGLGIVVSLALLIVLALPGGWHTINSMVKNYSIGIYRLEISKGKEMQIAAGAMNLVGGLAGQAGAVDKINDLIKDETLWIWDAPERFCLESWMQDAAALFGMDELRKSCQMWRRVAIASYATAACLVIGSALLVVGSIKNCNKRTLSKSNNTMRKIGLVAGPVHALIGIAVYGFMTMDFHPSGDDKNNDMNFGGAFWGAVIITVLSALPAVVSMMEGDQPPDYTKGSKNRDRGDSRSVQMQVFEDDDHWNQAGGQQQGPPGQQQQGPPGMGHPGQQQHGPPGMGPPPMGQQPMGPPSMGQQPMGPPGQQWQGGPGPGMGQRPMGPPAQQWQGGAGGPQFQQTPVPTDAWNVIAKAAGQQAWVPPPFNPSPSPAPMPMNVSAPLLPAPSPPTSWGLIPMTTHSSGGLGPPSSNNSGIDKSQPDFRPSPYR